MRLKALAGGLAAVAAVAVWLSSAAPAAVVAADSGPRLSSIGPLTFGPDGILFAADPQAATIYALNLGAAAASAPQGAKDIGAIDQKIAALLGTDVKEVVIADLAVHPKTRNAYIAVMRGAGDGAKPALLRVDGNGKLDLVAMDGLEHTKVSLPNAPAAPAAGVRRDPRRDSITDMALVGGQLFVAGLSNEEFASKLRAISYPFAQADGGASVEIYHGNHGALETRSPVYAFVPYSIDNTPHLIAGYLCTPLVKFPVASLKSDGKVLGTTIAELGNRNRPIDMVVYKKDGREFLLMSNTARGVMKIPTADFGKAAAITTRVETETGGLAYETVAAMKGIEQLDLLDSTRTLVLARVDGALNLQTVVLP